MWPTFSTNTNNQYSYSTSLEHMSLWPLLSIRSSRTINSLRILLPAVLSAINALVRAPLIPETGSMINITGLYMGNELANKRKIEAVFALIKRIQQQLSEIRSHIAQQEHWTLEQSQSLNKQVHEFQDYLWKLEQQITRTQYRVNWVHTVFKLLPSVVLVGAAIDQSLDHETSHPKIFATLFAALTLCYGVVYWAFNHELRETRRTLSQAQNQFDILQQQILLIERQEDIAQALQIQPRPHTVSAYFSELRHITPSELVVVMRTSGAALVLILGSLIPFYSGATNKIASFVSRLLAALGLPLKEDFDTEEVKKTIGPLVKKIRDTLHLNLESLRASENLVALSKLTNIPASTSQQDGVVDDIVDALESRLKQDQAKITQIQLLARGILSLVFISHLLQMVYEELVADKASNIDNRNINLTLDIIRASLQIAFSIYFVYAHATRKQQTHYYEQVQALASAKPSEPFHEQAKNNTSSSKYVITGPMSFFASSTGAIPASDSEINCVNVSGSEPSTVESVNLQENQENQENNGVANDSEIQLVVQR
ncbi:MAG: hypothetical protein Tsb005_18250 [Gammaproteobacteria bacterium]